MKNALTEFTFLSVCARLVLAVCAGGLIGYGRTRKSRTTGLRTFSLTALGAALSVLIAAYEYEMMLGDWAPIVAQTGLKFDASRFAAAVIGGIGFLAAGSIIAMPHQQVEGLTTATGLFASVCMGIAAGAGFYWAVLLSIFLIILALEVMQPLERKIQRRLRNITFAVEFESIENIDDISAVIRDLSAVIQDIDIERTNPEGDKNPSAVFRVRMAKKHLSHTAMLSSIAEQTYVYSIEEIV